MKPSYIVSTNTHNDNYNSYLMLFYTTRNGIMKVHEQAVVVACGSE